MKTALTIAIGLVSLALAATTKAQYIEYDQELARQFKQTLVSGRDLSYPPEAAKLKKGGSGVFIMFLRPDGTVETVNIEKSTGPPLIDLETKRTLLTYRFKPGTRRTQVFPVKFVPHPKP
ncbi:MAG TPA: TonB family protein [Chthoniobacterales bacterium]